MKNLTLSSIVLLLLGLFLFGCASSEMVTKKSLGMKLNNFNTLYFSAESVIPDSLTQEIANFNDTFMKCIKEANMFKDVQLGNFNKAADGTLIVKAEITDINRVGSMSHFLIGMWAGKASMTVDLSFIDSATGNVIGSFEVTGKSGNNAYAGGTGSAIDKTAESIVDLIKINYR